jgi:hypothetical protein
MIRCAMQVTAALLLSSLPLTAQNADQGSTASLHRQGPHALEGWTLDTFIPGHGTERYPHTLIIAAHGKVLHRFDGPAFFIWNWMFQDDGKQVAYESGPLHFSLTCVLADVRTGRQLADYDCFRELPADAPPWVKELEHWSAKPH